MYMALKAQKHQSELLREQQLPTQEQSAVEGSADASTADGQLSTTENEKCSIPKNFWMQWYSVLKHVFPIYLATHLAFFVITCLSVLFILKDFSWQALPISTLWKSWDHWDTTIFTTIAKYGFTDINRTAFFSFFSFL